MNKKQAKAARRGYKEAGEIYWTQEMEKILRGLHRRNRGLLAAVAVQAIFIVGFIFRGAGVL